MSWARQIHLKNPAEITIMREAGRINALALAAARALLRPNVSTADLNAAAEEVLRKHGAISPFKGYGQPPFPASTTISINEQLVHGIPGKRQLRDGDVVSVDCGTIFEGYVADSAFTAGVGELSEGAAQLLDVTEKALYAGVAQMRSGKTTGDISAAIQSYVEGRGYHVTRAYTGHGVGRSMHEGPEVPNYGVPGRGPELRPGMVIAIEPMVLVGTPETRVLADQWTVVSADGSLTAHFEHSVAVTDGEPLLLTVP